MSKKLICSFNGNINSWLLYVLNSSFDVVIAMRRKKRERELVYSGRLTSKHHVDRFESAQ